MDGENGTRREMRPCHASFDRLSMDVVDENMLLSETEGLLATLDATAFAAASPLVPRGSVTYHQWDQWDREASVAPRPPCDVKQGTGKKRIQSVAKTKHECAALRKITVELEAQLMELQQRNSSAVHKQQLLQTAWRDIADRQRHQRRLTEAENQKLKTMLFEIFNAPEKFAEYAVSAAGSSLPLALPNYNHGPPKISICLEPSDLRVLKTCEMLLSRLDAAYADMETVSHTNELSTQGTESSSFFKNKTLYSSSGEMYVELLKVDVAPIPAALMAKLSWEAMRKWHHKDNAYSHPCADRPDDTFVVNYRMASAATTENSSVVLALAMRRYFMQDRFVFVWTSQCDGEKDLTDMYTKETGWLAISTFAGPAGSGSPITVVRSCFQIFPHNRKNGPMQAKKVNALLNCVMSGFEEDVTSIYRMVESEFLKMIRMESTCSGNDFAMMNPYAPLPLCRRSRLT